MCSPACAAKTRHLKYSCACVYTTPPVRLLFCCVQLAGNVLNSKIIQCIRVESSGRRSSISHDTTPPPPPTNSTQHTNEKCNPHDKALYTVLTFVPGAGDLAWPGARPAPFRPPTPSAPYVGRFSRLWWSSVLLSCCSCCCDGCSMGFWLVTAMRSASP